MASKVKDDRRPPDPVKIYSLALDCVFRSGSSTSQYPIKVVGNYKSIDSIYDGAFVPGIMRVNPVTIRHGYGTCSSGILKGCSNYWGRLEVIGPYMGFRNSMNFGNWDLNLERWSATAVNAKLGEAKAGLGQMLAELRETLRMLVNPFAAVHTLVRNSKKPGALAEFGSNAWLQWRYGIKPLMQDIAAILDLLESGLSQQLRVLKSVRATKTKKTSVEYKTPTGYSSFGFVDQNTIETTIKSTSIVYYSQIMQLNKLKQVGLSPENLIDIAWEVLPYSFIVDWFLNVGSYLRALRPTPEFSLLGGCTSQKIVIVDTHEPIAPYFGSPGTAVQSFSPSRYVWTSETLIRKSGTPVAQLAPFTGQMSITHLIDSLALAIGRIVPLIRNIK